MSCHTRAPSHPRTLPHHHHSVAVTLPLPVPCGYIWITGIIRASHVGREVWKCRAFQRTGEGETCWQVQFQPNLDDLLFKAGNLWSHFSQRDIKPFGGWMKTSRQITSTSPVCHGRTDTVCKYIYYTGNREQSFGIKSWFIFIVNQTTELFLFLHRCHFSVWVQCILTYLPMCTCK